MSDILNEDKLKNLDNHEYLIYRGWEYDPVTKMYQEPVTSKMSRFSEIGALEEQLNRDQAILQFVLNRRPINVLRAAVVTVGYSPDDHEVFDDEEHTKKHQEIMKSDDSLYEKLKRILLLR